MPDKYIKCESELLQIHVKIRGLLIVVDSMRGKLLLRDDNFNVEQELHAVIIVRRYIREFLQMLDNLEDSLSA